MEFICEHWTSTEKNMRQQNRKAFVTHSKIKSCSQRRFLFFYRFFFLVVISVVICAGAYAYLCVSVWIDMRIIHYVILRMVTNLFSRHLAFTQGMKRVSKIFSGETFTFVAFLLWIINWMNHMVITESNDIILATVVTLWSHNSSRNNTNRPMIFFNRASSTHFTAITDHLCIVRVRWYAICFVAFSHNHLLIVCRIWNLIISKWCCHHYYYCFDLERAHLFDEKQQSTQSVTVFA